MIKILVADDSNEKVVQLQEKVFSKVGILEENVIFVQDIISAKRALLENKFDLMIIDLQLPLRFNNTPTPLGGLTLLRELKGSTRYMLPLNIIGLTEYEDSLENASQEFNDQLHSLLKYSRTEVGWANKLENQINHIIKSKDTQCPKDFKYNYDLAIFCALADVEFRSLKSLPVEWREIFIDGDTSRYFEGIIRAGEKKIKTVITCCDQMGMVSATVSAMKLMMNFSPKYLVMSGIMAGVEDKVNLGDIVVFDMCWDYGHGKIIEDSNGNITLHSDPLPIRMDVDLKASINKLRESDSLIQSIKNDWVAQKPESSLKVHIGGVASGAAVVSTRKIIDNIISQNRNLLGIEMEGYGVLYAAEHTLKPRPKCLIVKSISDYADQRKNDTYQPYAAYTSSKFIYELAKGYLEFD